MAVQNGRKLVIVESPAKAKTINKILGSDYKVAASVGHLIDLPKSKLGVDIENGYTPEYKTIKGRSKIINDLKKLAKTASGIILATDPDREGEAIAYHIAASIRNVNSKIDRIEFNEITKPAVLDAIQHPRKIDDNRVNAQQARRVMDRIVGYMVSPILWKTIYKGLSAGRVQSVALRLICEREDEIDKFVPVEYWNIDVKLETNSGENFIARLYKIDDRILDPKKFRIKNKQEAEDHYQKLKKETYTVSDVKKEEVIKRPSPPFITSTLQQDAARRFRMPTSRIMKIAQQLYEGIDLGAKGNVGLITYMRTDSTRISNEALGAVRKYVAESYGTDYLPQKANFYKTKKSAQDAHEAIRPANISTDFEPRKLKKFLANEQLKIYELIWKRFVASQMKPAIAEKTTVDVSAGKYLFRVSGEVITFRGFLQAYQPDEDDPNGEQEDTPHGIPRNINKGELLKLLDIILNQLFTKPPPRFTESMLVKTLDKLGIGRPSTYAQIISTIFTRQYVERENRTLKPTELGRIVSRLLSKNFPNIFNVEFTAAMEDELDKIEQNKSSYVDSLNDFYFPFKETLEKIQDHIDDIKLSLQDSTEEKCEVCGRPMIIRWGRNGKFMACSGYPECKNTRPIEEPQQPEESGEICDVCGSPMVVKRGRYGEFLACSRYPECKTTKPISTNVPCPEDGCDGTIVQRQSRRGKIFYGCSNYPKCNYALWNRPIAQQCPECQFPLMEEKVTQKDGYFLQCPKCKHKEILEKISEENVD